MKTNLFTLITLGTLISLSSFAMGERIGPQLPRGWDVEQVKPNISENAENRGRSEDSGQTLSREEKNETDEKELGKGMPSPHQVGMCDRMH